MCIRDRQHRAHPGARRCAGDIVRPPLPRHRRDPALCRALSPGFARRDQLGGVEDRRRDAVDRTHAAAFPRPDALRLPALPTGLTRRRDRAADPVRPRQAGMCRDGGGYHALRLGQERHDPAGAEIDAEEQQFLGRGAFAAGGEHLVPEMNALGVGAEKLGGNPHPAHRPRVRARSSYASRPRRCRGWSRPCSRDRCRSFRTTGRSHSRTARCNRRGSYAR